MHFTSLVIAYTPGSSFLSLFSSAEDTKPPLRRFLFLLALLCPKRWLVYAFALLNFPFAVLLILLAVPRCVFILGTNIPPLSLLFAESGSQYHDHVSSLKLRMLFNFSIVLNPFGKFFAQFKPKVRVGNFPTPEHDSNFYLIFIF